MEFSVYELIFEVQKRPQLWNVHHKRYHDRQMTDNGWEAIGQNLNVPKEVVKSKWKNTRDHFNKEFKKIPPSKARSAEGAAAAYRGKWPYFKDMLFLKDMDKSDDIHDDVIGVPEASLYDSSNGTQPEAQMTPPPPPTQLFHADTSVPELNFESAFVALDGGGPPPPRKRRRTTEEEETFEKILAIEQEKLEFLRSAKEIIELDDDLHFLKSLVPFLKPLGPLAKLKVRSKIQQVIADELRVHQNFEGPSTPHPNTFVTAVYDHPRGSSL